jgi:transcriptional regulator with XRE-family HTH domain
MPKRIQEVSEEYVIHRRSLGEAIGTRIRVRRKQHKLTQDQVRSQLELYNVVISRSQYSRLETGEAMPDAAALIALRAILTVSYDWLLNGDTIE